MTREETKVHIGGRVMSHNDYFQLQQLVKEFGAGYIAYVAKRIQEKEEAHET